MRHFPAKGWSTIFIAPSPELKWVAQYGIGIGSPSRDLTREVQRVPYLVWAQHCTSFKCAAFWGWIRDKGDDIVFLRSMRSEITTCSRWKDTQFTSRVVSEVEIAISKVQNKVQNYLTYVHIWLSRALHFLALGELLPKEHTYLF